PSENGPVVKGPAMNTFAMNTFAMNTFAMNASAGKAAAEALAAMCGFCGDWSGQCHNGRERYSCNTPAACDADRFHAAYSSRSAAGVAADEGSKGRSIPSSSPIDEITFKRRRVLVG